MHCRTLGTGPTVSHGICCSPYRRRVSHVHFELVEIYFDISMGSIHLLADEFVDGEDILMLIRVKYMCVSVCVGKHSGQVSLEELQTPSLLLIL